MTDFPWISSVSPGMYRDNTSIRLLLLPFISFQVHYSSYSLTLRTVVEVTDSVFKINQKNEDVFISLFISSVSPSFSSFSSFSLHCYRNTNHQQNLTISHLLLISAFAVVLCGKWDFLQSACGDLKAITATFRSSQRIP